MTDSDDLLDDKLTHDWLMDREYEARAMRRMRDERDEDLEEEDERD